MHDFTHETVPKTSPNSTEHSNGHSNEHSTGHSNEQTQSTFHSHLFLMLGIFIFLILTSVVRFFGTNIFKANEPLLALGLYLTSSIGILFTVFWLYKWQKVTTHMQFQASILLVLPTMIFGSILMVSFRVSFPNLAASSDSAVASWLLWCTGFILLAAFMNREEGSPDE